VSAEPVVIVDHDARWFDDFDVAAAELRGALRPWIVDIEHIGSTAVAALAAKPIIDIQVAVVSLDVDTQIVAAVEALGYTYVPEYERELPNRRYFRRTSSTGVTTHHVHLVERTDHEWWDRHIRFRDWLRAHPDDRDRYAALKRALAAEYRDDRDGYTEVKSGFIDSVVERANYSARSTSL
jgi:GrpB-like predicted nucleotidyltransferase (UPF0157 family)